jgi:hypothetical protein
MAAGWLSVGDGFITRMTAAPSDAATAMSGDAVLPRRRGKSKAPNFKYDGPVSVIRIELDATGDLVRRRMDRHWGAVFRLRRALQRDAQARCRAYWAAHYERKRDPKGLRERLGLSRKGIEAVAKSHIEASGWMRDHLTKAVGQHVADEVWETVVRHLFPDKSGCRHGPPRVGLWWDFTRIAGRARSHTNATPTWETYRLVGTLDGHLEAYRHLGLSAAVATSVAAAAISPGISILAQPAQLPAPVRPAGGSWWDHDGARRWCSPACPPGIWCCRFGCPRGRVSGRTLPISWPIPACGTRSIWCGCATAKHPEAGGTTPICWYTEAGINLRAPGSGAPRSLPAGGPG